MRGLPALLLLCACASGGGRPASPGLVPLSELPARERRVLETWRRGGAEWELERESVRGDPALSRFLVDNLVVEMVRSFDRSAIRRAGQASGPFERAQSELVLQARASLPVLAGLLAVKDGIVAWLVADTLARIGVDALAPAAAGLEHPEAEVRRRAADLLARLPHAGAGEPALLERLGRIAAADEAWIVRGQAALALGARASRHEHKGHAQAVLTRALGDPDAAVARSACEALGVLGEIRAAPALIRRLETAARRGDLALLRAAQSSLRRLSGGARDLPPDEWWKWWESLGSAASAPAEPR